MVMATQYFTGKVPFREVYIHALVRDAKGQRVRNIEVRNASAGTWAAIDPAKTYRLFVLSFNATGGDGYKTLAAVPAARDVSRAARFSSSRPARAKARSMAGP